MRKFRHYLIYAIEKDGLIILAVAHHSRRAGYWIGRVGNVASSNAPSITE